MRRNAFHFAVNDVEWFASGPSVLAFASGGVLCVVNTGELRGAVAGWRGADRKYGTERWQVAAGFGRVARDALAGPEPSTFTTEAMMTAPKRKDNTPCPNAIDRIRVDVRLVSGMAKLIPMAKRHRGSL